jgi:Na+/H+ antiporter NhaD/arsenite permease-like protein
MITVGIIFLVTYIGLSLGGLPYFRLDRAGIAIVGAAAVVVAGILSFNEALAAIDFNTIVLLLGMMMVAANLRIAGFFAVLSAFIKKRFNSPAALLAAVILSSGLLSAIYVNDTVCIFFTPFVIEICASLSLNPLPFLIGLVTASNIGSVATITGNPQNMLIGTFSGIEYFRFAQKLLPVALVGLIIDFLVLYIFYGKKLTSTGQAKEIIVSNVVHKPLLIKTLIVTLAMLVFFFAGFNIGLVAIAAAAFLLITRRVKPDKVYHYINWNLLLMFCGLFVVIGAVEKSGLSNVYFGWASKLNIQNGAVFSGVVAAISNLVSNVPAVILFKPVVSRFANQEKFWLLLAMASTFAGNLTIMGSVANLIVMEQSKGHVKIGFWEYFRIGLPVTLITIVVGFLML